VNQKIYHQATGPILVYGAVAESGKTGNTHGYQGLGVTVPQTAHLYDRGF
jgi:hypothetical protein